MEAEDVGNLSGNKQRMRRGDKEQMNGADRAKVSYNENDGFNE